MKKIISVILFLPFIVNAQKVKENTFSLTGKLVSTEGALDEYVYLVYGQNGTWLRDSCRINNGNYEFKGKVEYPSQASLYLKIADSTKVSYKKSGKPKPYQFSFYIDKGTLTAVSDNQMMNTVVHGSAAEDDQQKLNVKLAPIQNERTKLRETIGRPAYEKKDTLGMQKYRELDEVQSQAEFAESLKFMQENSGSGITFDLLKAYVKENDDFNLGETESIFKKLKPSLKKSKEGKAYGKSLQNAKLTAPGAKAPDFTLKDRQGKSINLSSLKGKVVIVDFWGSWCGPCRMSHPHLKDLYAKYKSSGLEILGVANEFGTKEKQYSEWTQAMDEDGMTWLNVIIANSETDKVRRQVTDVYNVNAFPTKIIINKKGVIVKRIVGSNDAAAKELDKLVEDLIK